MKTFACRAAVLALTLLAPAAAHATGPGCIGQGPARQLRHGHRWPRLTGW